MSDSEKWLLIVMGIIVLLLIGWLIFKYVRQKRTKNRGGHILNPRATICWNTIKDPAPDIVSVGDVLTVDGVRYKVNNYVSTQSKDATIYMIVDELNPAEKFTLKLIKKKEVYDKEEEIVNTLDRSGIFTQCPDLMRATAYKDIHCIGENKQVMIMPYLKYSLSEALQEIHSTHSDSYNVPTFKGKIVYDLVDIILCLNRRNVYYLDIKPANIMFTSKMGLVLIDLGSIFSPADFARLGGDVDRTYIPPGLESLHSIVPTRADLEPLEVYTIGIFILQLVARPITEHIIQKTLGYVNLRAQEIHDDTWTIITEGRDLKSASVLLIQIAYMCLEPIPSNRPTLQVLLRRHLSRFI